MIANDDLPTEAFLPEDMIYAEGLPGSLMYLVLAGEVDLWSGRSHRGTVGPGEVFGEMALVERAHRDATATARTACVLVPLDQERLHAVLERPHDIGQRVLRALDDRVLQLQVDSAA